MNDPLTVGEISRLTGVTVRALHHYDEIGLVSPGMRSDAGYRLYGPGDVARLQEVLVLRELGMRLDDIRRIVDEPGPDRATSLERHRRRISAKVDHLLRMLDAIDTAIAAERGGIPMANEDVLGVFGDFDPAAYEDEVEDRWGGTDAYRESARRTARYTARDWEQMRRESAEIDAAFVALMEAGVDPDGEAAMDVAERHRSHISKWFYACTSEIHAELGRMYVADPRFAERIDATAAGLAEYMSAAIGANAAR